MKNSNTYFHRVIAAMVISSLDDPIGPILCTICYSSFRNLEKDVRWLIESLHIQPVRSKYALLPLAWPT